MSLAFSKGALNGIDRFVSQARSITFFYCKHGGSSRGMRCVSVLCPSAFFSGLNLSHCTHLNRPR